MSSKKLSKIQKQIEALSKMASEIEAQEKNKKKDAKYEILFGSSNEPFSTIHLKQLIESKDVIEIIEYLEIYFAVIYNAKDGAVYMHWDPSVKDKAENIVFYTSKGLKEFLPECFDIIGKTESGKKLIIFSCYQYITNNIVERYKFITDYDNFQGNFFKKGDQYYINRFNGYLHTEKKSFASFDEKTRENVKKIWRHTLDVWCSGNKHQFKFFIKPYIAHMSIGQKQTVALYLNGEEGIGKTSNCDFFRLKVLGPNITVSAGNSSQIHNDTPAKKSLKSPSKTAVSEIVWSRFIIKRRSILLVLSRVLCKIFS